MKGRANVRRCGFVYTSVACMMSLVWTALVSALAVKFGKQETWASRPVAKIKVVARGAICPSVVQVHLIEAKQAVVAMLEGRRGFKGDIDMEDISVEIQRRLLVDDEHASISTSIVMSMTAGAVTVML